MDYSLKSLRDAFEDAEVKASRRGYDLYAILLATSLDQNFVLEYLSFFHELDVLTGERVLIIGPQLGPPGTKRRGNGTVPSIPSSDLHSIQQIVKHDLRSDAVDASTHMPAAEHFLAFMQEQTRESYAIARYLGISTNTMPLLVFFDSLDAPHDRVEWSLENITGREFVRSVRDLLRTIGAECEWEIENQTKHLEQRAKSFRREYFLQRDVPYELRQQWEAYSTAKNELDQISALIGYHENLATLRAAYDLACADSDLRLPLHNIGDTIALLETGKIDPAAFSHLANHYRRWKSRMPAYYREAVNRLSYPGRASSYIREGVVVLAREEAKLEYERLNKQTPKLKDAYDAKRNCLIREVEDSLVKARQRAHRPKPPPLEVIQRILRSAATIINQPTKPISLRSMVAEVAARVPRVFISYSHESVKHAARVLELAQRLRADGIDCWIDQFEQGPSEGFPRWMQQQIARSDIVLLVCTETYRRRFDGMEEHSKGLGVNFEGYLILQELYDAATRNRKFIPVLLSPATRENIPMVLRGTLSFEIPSSYEVLVSRILELPGVVPHPLGQRTDRGWR
jgi:hypothetical protein